MRVNYTIKEAAEKANLRPHTLRYYEEEKLLPHVKRDENGYRSYSEEDLLWIETIACLRGTNISIADLKEMVELTKENKSALYQRIHILETHQKKLRQQQEELKQMEKKVTNKINHLKQLENTSLKDLEYFRLC